MFPFQPLGVAWPTELFRHARKWRIHRKLLLVFVKFARDLRDLSGTPFIFFNLIGSLST
jgi:hypothetical protein